MDATELIRSMQPVLAAEPAVAVAWLFGSAARGTMRKDSDVDVAVVFRDGLADTTRDAMLAELASRLEFDDYPSVKPQDIQASLAYAHAVIANDSFDDIKVG